MVELYLLQQLIAVYENGSFNNAAKQLHLTQPTITRSMQKIEKEFGVPLFERSQNKITFTKAGILAYQYAKKILHEQEEMMEHVQQAYTFQVGFCAPGPSYVLQKVIPSLAYPNDFYTNEVLLDALRNQKYQFVILSQPCNDLDVYSQKLCTEQLYISAPILHPLTKYTSLSFSQLNGSTFLMAEKIGIWKNIVEKNMPQSKFLLQDSIDALSQIIISSTLLSFATNITITSYHTQERRTYIPITDTQATITFYVCCLKENLPLCNPIFEQTKNIVKTIL